MADVLVIDDEPQLVHLLSRLLIGAGHRVDSAGSGLDGLRQALAGCHDLIVLDLTMPDLSGDDLLKALIMVRPAARVMVLSSAVDVRRRIEVLDSGAVDFVAKPFRNNEFLARVRARLRETQSVREQQTKLSGEPEGIALDAHQQRLMVDGRAIALSQREFTLVACLMARRGEVCTREELLAAVWGLAHDPGTNVVDVCVRRVRMKISADLIETVRHVGYRFAA